MVEQRTDVEIRAAMPDDARRIAEVHVTAWRDAYRGMLPDGYLDRLSIDDRETRWLGAIADPAPGSGVLVAEAREAIVGFASFDRSRDDDAEEATGEVPAIYVDPAVVGTGVGRRLFTAATDALRRAGYRRATLWVLEANARARSFYERAGWKWDGTVSHHDFDCANEPIVRYGGDL
jgi:GNAT superfamily N-acetyltransferase